MRKVILSMMVSVDGFMEDHNHEINWHNFDEEMGAYMMDFIKTVDTFLYGRKSYELMLDHWPKETGDFADIMNNTPKVVFSRSLKEVSWNSRLVSNNVAEEVSKLKQTSGKDMALFAGADIASTFIKENLIDEYRLLVNPVALGKGTPLFKNVEKPVNLQLIGSRTFKCGNILLRYQPK